jgi:hypothetical protein
MYPGYFAEVPVILLGKTAHVERSHITLQIRLRATFMLASGKGSLDVHHPLPKREFRGVINDQKWGANLDVKNEVQDAKKQE